MYNVEKNLDEDSVKTILRRVRVPEFAAGPALHHMHGCEQLMDELSRLRPQFSGLVVSLQNLNPIN
jgi:hypothetical protein